METRNYYTLTLTLLGAVKLVLNAFNIDLFTDKDMNDIANAVATILAACGVIMTHLPKHPSFIEKFFKKKAPVSVDQPKQVETPVQPPTQPIQPAPVEQAQVNNTVQK